MSFLSENEMKRFLSSIEKSFMAQEVTSFGNGNGNSSVLMTGKHSFPTKR
jgi:hypothetical protein